MVYPRSEGGHERGLAKGRNWGKLEDCSNWVKGKMEGASVGFDGDADFDKDDRQID